MKLTVKREDLLKVVGAAAGVASNRQINPMLKNIAIKAKKGSIELLATDMTRFVRFSIPAQVDEVGEVVVDANLFSTFASFLESTEIKIEGNEKIKVLGNQVAHFQTAPFEDFPIMPEPKGKWTPLDRKVLEDVIAKVGFAVGDQTSKAFLQSIYLDDSKAVATNAQHTAIVDAKLGLTESCLLNPTSLSVLKNLDGEIQSIFSSGWSFFKSQNGMVGILATSGDYPKVTGFIEKWKSEKPPVTLSVDKANLLKILQITDYFISRNKDVTNVDLIWEKSAIRIKLDIPQLTEFDNTVTGKVKGKEGKIRIRPGLFYQGVQCVEGDTVILKIFDSFKPILVEDEKRPDWMYLIMPVASGKEVAEWEKQKKVDVEPQEADEEEF